MKNNIRLISGAALVLFSALVVSAVWAGPEDSSIKGKIDEASMAFQNQKYEKVVSLLQPLEDQNMNDDSEVRVQYLLGLAMFRKTDLELKEKRKDGLQAKDKLVENQVISLRGAFEHFKAAHRIDPESKYAPECLYMTGKILDWGYMQRFNESLANYTATFEAYPETDFGQRAHKDYDLLRSKMSPHHSDPNMKLGAPRGQSH